MSTTVTFFEELHIAKDSPKRSVLSRKLADYILQYNGMKGLEELDITYLELICGDDRASVEEQMEVEPGNVWRITQNGIDLQSVNHVVWEDDSPLMKLVRELAAGRETVFRLSGSMTRHYNTDYTYRYWLAALGEITPEDGIEYRCAEAADTDGPVVAYFLNGNGMEEVPRDGSVDLVADIPLWFAETFQVNVSVEDEEQFEAFEEKVGGALQQLADDLENEYLEPDVFEGEAELFGSLELRAEHVPGFLKSLQAVCDAAKELGAETECTFEMLPEERTNHGIEPFAVLRIDVKDGKVEATACWF